MAFQRTTVFHLVLNLRIERHAPVRNRRVEKGTVKCGLRVQHRMGAFRGNSAAIEKNEAVYPRERPEAMRNHDDYSMCSEIRDGFKHFELGRNIESRGRFVENERSRFSQELPG